MSAAARCAATQSTGDAPTRLVKTREKAAGLSSHRLKDRTLEDLLRRADAALYEAKRAGRNQLVMAP